MSSAARMHTNGMDCTALCHLRLNHHLLKLSVVDTDTRISSLFISCYPGSISSSSCGQLLTLPVTITAAAHVMKHFPDLGVSSGSSSLTDSSAIMSADHIFFHMHSVVDKAGLCISNHVNSFFIFNCLCSLFISLDSVSL